MKRQPSDFHKYWSYRRGPLLVLCAQAKPFWKSFVKVGWLKP